MVLAMVSSKYKNGSGFGDENSKSSGYGVDKVLKVFTSVKMDLAMGTSKYLNGSGMFLVIVSSKY